MGETSAGDKTSVDFKIHELRKMDDFPSWLTPDELAKFMHESLKPYEDPVEDIRRGISDTLEPKSREPGFIVLAEIDQKPVGAVIMMRTGMKGYIPENILVWVAVDPSMRGKGLGGKIIKHSFDLADGDVKLHVEYDNPAKRLYERLGMTNKYAEMRYIK